MQTQMSIPPQNIPVQSTIIQDTSLSAPINYTETETNSVFTSNAQIHSVNDDSNMQSQQVFTPTTCTQPNSTSSTQTSVRSQPSECKPKRSNRSTERIPKLTILSVQNGTLVDCSMESKLKTIKFKFDISDVNPVDVANDLVCWKEKKNS